MSFGEIAQLISAFAAVGALLVSIHNARKIEEVRHGTNSLKDELVAVTRKDALAEGRLQGRGEPNDG